MSDNGYLSGVQVHCTLKKEESIEKDFMVFLEDIEECLQNLGFWYTVGKDEHDGNWINYIYKNIKDKTTVHVFCWYAASKYCKMVGTGEFVEKTKRVCI
jgi:hypothetical protein